jgi:hypothetical protein
MTITIIIYLLVLLYLILGKKKEKKKVKLKTLLLLYHINHFLLLFKLKFILKSITFSIFLLKKIIIIIIFFLYFISHPPLLTNIQIFHCKIAYQRYPPILLYLILLCPLVLRKVLAIKRSLNADMTV